MRQSLEEVKQKIVPILKASGATRSALFGSVAKGEETVGSDVDILVELPQEQTLLDLVDLKLKLEAVLQRSVDLVEYSTIKPRLREHILSEQVPIL